MNTMRYKEYVGAIEYDPDAKLFHGEIINLNDVVTFQGSSVAELEQALQDSVEDYLEFCAALNRVPEKPYSGKFTVRIQPELHRALVLKARQEQLSVNKMVERVLQLAVA